MHTPLRDQLVTARKRAKLRQEDIAEAVGWAKHTHVSKIENGHTSTQIEEAEKWAAACGYEIRLVPLNQPDPEGLRAIVDAIEDPFARMAVATFARLVRRPKRFWAHFLEDFNEEEQRAQRAADRDAESA